MPVHIATLNCRRRSIECFSCFSERFAVLVRTLLIRPSMWRFECHAGPPFCFHVVGGVGFLCTVPLSFSSLSALSVCVVSEKERGKRGIRMRKRRGTYISCHLKSRHFVCSSLCGDRLFCIVLSIDVLGVGACTRERERESVRHGLYIFIS